MLHKDASLSFLYPAVLIYPLAGIPVPAAPNLGHRGIRRRLILDKGGSFGLFEPLMRLVAAWISRLRIGSLSFVYPVASDDIFIDSHFP